MKKIAALLLIIATLALCLTSCSKAKKSYKKLDEHIISTATTVKDGIHSVILGANKEADGATYTRTASRNETSITLALTVSDDEGVLYIFSLIMQKGDLDAYRWEYIAQDGDTMSGTVVPKEYLKAAYSLNYVTTNIYGSYAVSSASGLAKGLCNYLLEHLEADLAVLKLDATDFDFKDYKK